MTAKRWNRCAWSIPGDWPSCMQHQRQRHEDRQAREKHGAHTIARTGRLNVAWQASLAARAASAQVTVTVRKGWQLTDEGLALATEPRHLFGSFVPAAFDHIHAPLYSNALSLSLSHSRDFKIAAIFNFTKYIYIYHHIYIYSGVCILAYIRCI